MDRVCAMSENITRSNLTRQHQVTTLAIVEKYHHMGSVLCQWKGPTLWWSLNFLWNRISIPFTLPGSYDPRCLHMGHVGTILFSDQTTHMEMFPNHGRRYLQQPVFISMFNNVWDVRVHILYQRIYARFLKHEISVLQRYRSVNCCKIAHSFDKCLLT